MRPAGRERSRAGDQRDVQRPGAPKRPAPCHRTITLKRRLARITSLQRMASWRAAAVELFGPSIVSHDHCARRPQLTWHWRRPPVALVHRAVDRLSHGLRRRPQRQWCAVSSRNASNTGRESRVSASSIRDYHLIGALSRPLQRRIYTVPLTLLVDRLSSCDIGHVPEEPTACSTAYVGSSLCGACWVVSIHVSSRS